MCVLQISFFDYLIYIPLFMSMHEGIVDNPLNMAEDKYTAVGGRDSKRPPSPQRDQQPLGFPLDVHTRWHAFNHAEREQYKALPPAPGEEG